MVIITASLTRASHLCWMLLQRLSVGFYKFRTIPFALYLSVSLKPLHTTTWWRHRMETFSALLALCEGNPPFTGGFPSQKPVTRSFDVFFDLYLNKRLSKYSRRRWFETPLRSLWRHCNDYISLNLRPFLTCRIGRWQWCILHPGASKRIRRITVTT